MGRAPLEQSESFYGLDRYLDLHGVQEARAAGRTLCQAGHVFDVAYTSVLKRAIKTLKVLETMRLDGSPSAASWRLNERGLRCAPRVQQD